MAITHRQDQHPYGGIQEHDGGTFETLLRDHVSALAYAPSGAGIAHYLDDPDLTAVPKAQVEDSALPLAAVETKFAADEAVFGDTAHNRQLERQWEQAIRHPEPVRAYFVCGVRTGIVTAVEVSGPGTGSGLLLPKLLRTTVANFPRAIEVSAGRAYLSKANYESAEGLGLSLYIPFKPNSMPSRPGRPGSRAWDRAFYFYQHDREEFLRRYRSHAVVESVMDAIKDRAGTCLHAKTQAGRANEVLLKLLAHNACVIAKAEQEGLLDEQAVGHLSETVGSAR